MLLTCCRHSLAVATLSLCLNFVADASAQEKDKEKTQEEAGKVTELFDGKTLTNWKEIDFGGQGPAEVKDGQIVIDMGEPLSGIQWTGPALPKVNYELTLEAMKLQGNDFFCGLTFPVKESYCSLILGGWGGGVTGLSSIDGMDASENETTDFRSFEKKRWYKVRVRVTDDHIQAWIDDDQIANVDFTDKRISLRIEVDISKPLGISTFRTASAIRNVKLRELPADAAPAKPNE